MKKPLFSRRYFILTGLILAVVLVLASCSAGTPTDDDGTGTPTDDEITTETVRVGFLGPLSGAVAEWGLPGLTGVNIWVDKINAAGGLQAGNKRYLVEVVKYDDEFTSDKALTGARKLVLEDGVDMIMCIGRPTSDSIMPFCEEHEVLVMGMEVCDIGPQWTYYLGVGENYPFYDVLAVQYIADTYPEIKKAAITVEDYGGIQTLVAMQAVCDINGIEVTYNKAFDPYTIDFAPLVTSILATDPDVIILSGTWPYNRWAIYEQAYLQGFEGIFEACEFQPTDFLQVVPAEFMEGSVAARCTFDEPTLPDYTKEFYEDWQARYGPEGPEDAGRTMYALDWLWRVMLEIWGYGVEQAGTVDSTAVRDALLASTDIPHTLGPANWWGEELYGINQGLIAPDFIEEFRDGKEVTVAQASFLDWWEENGEVMLEYYEDAGLLQWQSAE